MGKCLHIDESVEHCGDQWSETCTLWEPGRRYRMRVDVATYPPRYRALIDDLTQTWSVEQAPGGTG